SSWTGVFDDVYTTGEAPADPTFDTAGWTSSYDGSRIPREQMQVWAQDTVDRVLAARPERVLEIGCGTGMLLVRIAPHCAAYHGWDSSQAVLDMVGKQVAARGLSHVALARRAAHDIAAVAGDSVDLIVISSVAQYFPSIEYLTALVQDCARAVRPGG